MHAHFSKLFWGLLLVILDISIRGFDLLPDGLGYLIIASGCRGLSAESPRFSTSKNLCLVLGFLWLMDFLVHGVSRDVAIARAVFTMVVHCIMIWQLLGGLADYALLRDWKDLARRATNRRLAYVILEPGTILLVVAMRNDPSAIGIVFVLVIATLLLLVMILHLIYRFRKESFKT